MDPRSGASPLFGMTAVGPPADVDLFPSMPSESSWADFEQKVLEATASFSSMAEAFGDAPSPAAGSSSSTTAAPAPLAGAEPTPPVGSALSPCSPSSKRERPREDGEEEASSPPPKRPATDAEDSAAAFVGFRTAGSGAAIPLQAKSLAAAEKLLGEVEQSTASMLSQTRPAQEQEDVAAKVPDTLAESDPGFQGFKTAGSGKSIAISEASMLKARGIVRDVEKDLAVAAPSGEGTAGTPPPGPGPMAPEAPAEFVGFRLAGTGGTVRLSAAALAQAEKLIGSIASSPELPVGPGEPAAGAAPPAAPPASSAPRRVGLGASRPALGPRFRSGAPSQRPFKPPTRVPAHAPSQTNAGE
ncbi:hypothetical protein H696_03198 [Fonticula alba]|uniref:Uncharacterized protein n=1 Tax=Fonticula alba TaxID=691883 RepID=A0A058Z9P7_FONAL|nr:hypothetical protein H696_03198 [Fonticula alba]KCV70841.1 hypothetical protein H696_03198 [Fonticula alba]|eukprot:XP_009495357.1 hypothetical protein H696_03198 [Fonticula alba]